MANWQQELIAAEEREQGQRQGLDKPFGATVESATGDAEFMQVNYFGNHSRILEVTHPFMSTGSWIRAMPESGAQYVVTQRVDEALPQALTTFKHQAGDRVSAFRSSQGMYRPLQSGELELSSLGLAQTYYARRPKVESRGGVVGSWADQDKLTVGARAPLHTKNLLQYASGTIGDEYRLGLITRPTNSFQVIYPQIRGAYTAEELTHLINPANASPQILFQEQRGHVLDIKGKQIKQQATSIPLRYKSNYYANGDTHTDYEIDEQGNVFIRVADEGVAGYELRVPSGNYRKTVQLDEFTTIYGNRTDAVKQSVVHTVGNNYTKTVQNNINIATLNGGGSANSSAMVFDATPGATKVVISTASGHLMTFDDTSGSEAIYLIHKSGSQLVHDSTGSIKLVSSDGNFVFLDATSGTATITSKSGAYLTVQENVTFSDSTGKQIFTFGGDTLQLTASSDVVVGAQNVTINAGNVNIGSNAVFSAVLSENLEQLFDQHTHMTLVGPTTPPLPPYTAELVNLVPATAIRASNIKLKGNLL